MHEASVYRDQAIGSFACFECTTTSDLDCEYHSNWTRLKIIQTELVGNIEPGETSFIETEKLKIIETELETTFIKN